MPYRCANNTPSGLNAPDPTLPRSSRDVDPAADPNSETAENASALISARSPVPASALGGGGASLGDGAEISAQSRHNLGGAASLGDLRTSRLPARATREVPFDLPSEVLAEVRSRRDLAAISPRSRRDLARASPPSARGHLRAIACGPTGGRRYVRNPNLFFGSQVRSRELVECAGFRPAHYEKIRRSVCLHRGTREVRVSE